MKTSPIISTLILLNLAVLTYIFLWKSNAHRTTVNHQQASNQEGEALTPRIIEATPSFRFSTTPLSITINDNAGQTIYTKTEFSEFQELEEEEPLNIPINQELKSELQVIVQWEPETNNYNFFTMEFYGTDGAKFATAVKGDIYEDIVLKW